MGNSKTHVLESKELLGIIITYRFLKRKLEEYKRLKQEIEDLKREVNPVRSKSPKVTAAPKIVDF